MSRSGGWPTAIVLAALLMQPGPVAGIQCVGDCGLDGSVTVDEIVIGVGLALGQGEVVTCTPFDRSHDNAVTVDEILAAVEAALRGCTPNQPPETADLPAYLTYPGQQVRVMIPGDDSDGDTVRFVAAALPPGAMLDEDGGILSWDPAESDVGMYEIEYTVTDDGIPPLSASGRLALRVAVLEQCVELECDPALGCIATPVAIATSCCDGELPLRPEEPLGDCPGGARLVVGRNAEGFGPLRNCDELPVVSMSQGSTRVSMHVAARCIYTAEPANLRIQLYNKEFVLVNRTSRLSFDPVDNGYAAVFNVSAPIDDSEFEPFLLDGAEQELYVSVQDANGFLVERTMRVRTTRQGRDDLPEGSDSPRQPEP
jgi:hypothetical protein